MESNDDAPTGFYVEIPKSVKRKFDECYPGRGAKKRIILAAIVFAIKWREDQDARNILTGYDATGGQATGTVVAILLSGQDNPEGDCSVAIGDAKASAVTGSLSGLPESTNKESQNQD